MKEEHFPIAHEFLNFVNSSVSPFHAVGISETFRKNPTLSSDTSEKLLQEAGFKKIKEIDPWDVKPNGKYYYTRNQSSIVAFAIGGKYVRI